MAGWPEELKDTLLEWVSRRLLLARGYGAALPNWPPSQACCRALLEGRLDDAVDLPDNHDARYTVIDHLRGDAPHLLVAGDDLLEREVVIKVLDPADFDGKQNAPAEAQLMARVQHPNIVTILDVDPSYPYIVLEQLRTDLRSVQHRLAPEQLLDAYVLAGRGLAALHEHRLCHLDFKAENVLVSFKEERDAITWLWAKLADFGCVEEVSSGRVSRLALDRDGRLRDQRAFAGALWEAFTGGRPPPDGERSLPNGLAKVLGRALRPEPSRRWPDMTALLDVIEVVREQASSSSL